MKLSLFCVLEAGFCDPAALQVSQVCVRCVSGVSRRLHGVRAKGGDRNRKPAGERFPAVGLEERFSGNLLASSWAFKILLSQGEIKRARESRLMRER